MRKIINCLIKLGLFSIGVKMLVIGIEDMKMNVLAVFALLIWFSSKQIIKKTQRTWRRNRRRYRSIKRNVKSASKVLGTLSRFI